MTMDSKIEILYQNIRNKINNTGKHPFIIGIDGRSGSGKTSLADLLCRRLDGCIVFHVDDYFLRSEQRSVERLLTPGENFDRERMISEIIEPLSRDENVTYRKFSCASMELSEPISIEIGDVVIIEGSYAFHPDMRYIYDFKIFVEASYDVRIDRIASRNGKESLEIFKNRWMPLEEKYFEMYRTGFEPDHIYHSV